MLFLQHITQTYQPHLYTQNPPPSNQSPSPYNQQEPTSSNYAQTQSTSSSGGMSSLFDRVHAHAHKLGAIVKDKISVGAVHTHTHEEAGQCHEGAHDEHVNNRYTSFCPQREGNDVKWYVDACGYMWAVSTALEQARESIWILDCMFHASPHEFQEHELT